MKDRSFLLPVVISLLVAPALSQERKEDRTAASAAAGKAKDADLQFTEDGKDLLVRLMIEGPAVRQAVLTDYTIHDGKPGWDEPPIGVDKPRRTPQVVLRYLVIINRNLPGFIDGGPMAVPTPAAVRNKQRQEVTWRLTNFRNCDFQKEDATFRVEATRFEASPEQLRQVCPKIEKMVVEWDRQVEKTNDLPIP